MEARLAEEQAEGVSLRRQLAATAGARDDAAAGAATGDAGGWSQRARDLELALEASREQVGTLDAVTLLWLHRRGAAALSMQLLTTIHRGECLVTNALSRLRNAGGGGGRCSRGCSCSPAPRRRPGATPAGYAGGVVGGGGARGGCGGGEGPLRG